MYKLFGYELMPPDTTGAHIIAEYGRVRNRRPVPPYFDIASAGSGFQQVLMLLAFLHTRPGTVLLLDEPDAHLHIILQDAIYHELRTVAARQRSQLIVATHSEVIINSVEPRELCIVLSQPQMVADTAERNRLVSSLRVMSNEDVMRALQVHGVLYVEDYTDINILRAWAAQLKPSRRTASDDRSHVEAGGLSNERKWHGEQGHKVQRTLRCLEARAG